MTDSRNYDRRSFGSRDGGHAFAKGVKTSIVETLNWSDGNVYMDSDALANKAGTQKVDSGANLNASWATYYQAAMEEAPAMCFCLTEAWCRSEWCQQELIWHLAMRTGVDMGETDPEELAQHLFRQPSERLAAMRQGIFLVLADDYSKNSDIFKMLTETNLAVPIDQFFDRELQPLSGGGGGALCSQVSHFLDDVRLSPEYFRSQMEAKEVMSSVAKEAVVLLASLMQPQLLNTFKTALGNCQILGQLDFVLDVQFGEPFASAARVSKLLALDLLELLGCNSSFSFQAKFHFTMAAPIVLAVLVQAVYTLVKGSTHSGQLEILQDRKTKLFFLAAFLVYPLVSRTSFVAMACTQLGPDEHFMTADMSQACVDGVSPMALAGAIGVVLGPITIRCVN